MRATRPASSGARRAVARARAVLAAVGLGAAAVTGFAAGPAAAAVEREDAPPAAPPETETGDEACGVEPVWVTRAFPHGRSERARLRFVDCDGEPNLAALDELSLLARPYRLERPDEDALAAFREAADAETAARFVAPDVMRLDPGLLVRLQALAERFPGRRIAIVSGYRPEARATSRHRHGRALDLRIGGTGRRDVADAARALPETGVGYYPNSVFTHVDVREESAAWCDWSGPGEAPRYGPWPDPADEMPAPEEALLASILEQVEQALADAGGDDPTAALAEAAAVDPTLAPAGGGPPAAAASDGRGDGPEGAFAAVVGPATPGAAPPPDVEPVTGEPPPPPLTRAALDALLASIRATVAGNPDAAAAASASVAE